MKFLTLSLTACLLILANVSCSLMSSSPTAAPVVATVPETEPATSPATVETPTLVETTLEPSATLTPSATITETATPSLAPTLTSVPSITPTLVPARIAVLVTSACLFGPGSAYIYKYGLNATVWMAVIGRNLDGSWLNVKAPNDPDSNACWIKASQVEFNRGQLKDVPILWTALPYSNLYQPPQVSANRVGNEVTIFWQPVNMTEDDYRGYLIEAWVCQGGAQVFVPLGYVTSFDQNNSMMAMSVTDEPGCDIPSSARIYSAEKHGYSDYRMIPWPGFDSGLTATPGPSTDISSTPTVPLTSGLPQASLLEYTDCLYGPGSVYLYKTSLPAASTVEVIGRNLDGTWLEVQGVQGWNPCWIQTGQVQFDGVINNLPAVPATLPVSNQYGPPDPIARRNGNEVTVSWKAVWMSVDDVRGYLIEAWVCQGGKQVFLPVFQATTFAENNSTLSVKITDEAGCQEPSSARIYTAGKRGYSVWQKLFWPAN